MTDAPTPASAPLVPDLSPNARAAPLVRRLVDDAVRLGVRVSRDAAGVTTIDAGIDCPGSVEAGLLVADICMGGLGTARLRSESTSGTSTWPTWIDVASSQPVLACLGSQYAGWSLSASKEETGGRKFFALGSGPVRARAVKEPLYAELGFRDRPGPAVLVMEVDRIAPQVIVDRIVAACGITPSQLTLVYTPTRSVAGTTQVVARVLEVALHRAHEMKFPLEHVVDGSATVPLPAPVADGVQAMGRTNDAVLYGGRVHLQVTGDEARARELAAALPSSNSRDYGRGFAEIFQAAEYDFYKIDGALFAPAEVWVSHRESGRTWHAGALNLPLLLGQWTAEAGAAQPKAAA